MRLRRSPMVLDALLAVVLSGLSLAALATTPDQPGGWPAVVLAVLAVAPVAVRQRMPVPTLVVVAAALIAYGALGYGEWPSGAMGLVVAVFTVATLRPPAYGLLVAPVVLAVVLLSKLADSEVTWPQVLQALLVCLCAWVVGDGTRRWAQRAEAAAARGERLLADERLRIARELHDVVAHHMSVVALQTGLAGYVLDSDHATARGALADAGSASREALQEMGRLLDALRTDEAAPGYDPQPRLAQLEDLVERVAGLGLEVTLRWSGDRRELSAGLELCAFRVVQESLTNVLRHAGPGSSATVTVDYAEDLVVEVVDDGRGRRGASVPGSVPGSGRGIAGMRERADLYGGSLSVGPRAEGGFGVVLRLPYDAGRPSGELDPVRADRG